MQIQNRGIYQLKVHQYDKYKTDRRLYCLVMQKSLEVLYILKSSGQKRTKPLLKSLHWLLISDRITYKLSCMCYNSVTASTPQYLADLLQIYMPSCTLRPVLKQKHTKKTVSTFNCCAMEYSDKKSEQKSSDPLQPHRTLSIVEHLQKWKRDHSESVLTI